MRFLPIVGRELRWAARYRGIRRVRWWATLLAMVIGVLSLACYQPVSLISCPMCFLLFGELQRPGPICAISWFSNTERGIFIF